MKKQDLERLLQEREERISYLVQQLHLKEEQHKSDLQELQKKFVQYQQDEQEKMYQSWLQMNGQFMQRYMQEYLKQYLSIEVTCDYGGYVDVSLRLDGEEISQSSEQVISHNNPLEE